MSCSKYLGIFYIYRFIEQLWRLETELGEEPLVLAGHIPEKEREEGRKGRRRKKRR